MANEDRRSTKHSQEPPKTWGSLARKGAFRLAEDTRDAGTAVPVEREPQEWSADVWQDEGPVRAKRKPTSQSRTQSSRTPDNSLEVDVDVAIADLVKLLGEVRGRRAEARLREAAVAYANERYVEARSLLIPLVSEAPSSIALRELFGLTLYRLGRWKEAIKELEYVRTAGGGLVQHPVVMDSYRALRLWREVDDLWASLQHAGVESEILSEGRIVYAGSLADRGDLAGAIDLLRTGFRLPRKHTNLGLRHAYVLADLYERGGDMPSARTWFRRIADFDPEFADVLDRLEQL